ncbi:hypothetical protein [Streptomyces sp. SID7909]|uniref:hypothetical protein n=1 Tax=Streptomyces sp. SID7909 TaxID=2706092 RepID=UPI001EF2386E|nr:hypothetical protein [Streptomyces sp. SID7909]
MPLVALAAAGLVLTGCSSGDGRSGKITEGAPNRDPGPPESAEGSAKLHYSGGKSGEFTVESVRCAVMGRRLTAVTVPDSADSGAPANPSFTAVVSGDKTMSKLTTEDGTAYVHTSASGIAGFKSGDTWVVNVDGLTLGAVGSGQPITVDGTIACGSVVGS